LIALLTLFKEEPIKYLIDNKKDEEALKLIKKVYAPDQDYDYILKYLRMTG